MVDSEPPDSWVYLLICFVGHSTRWKLELGLGKTQTTSAVASPGTEVGVSNCESGLRTL
jgi:hypothetical protein